MNADITDRILKPFLSRSSESSGTLNFSSSSAFSPIAIFCASSGTGGRKVMTIQNATKTMSTCIVTMKMLTIHVWKTSRWLDSMNRQESAQAVL